MGYQGVSTSATASATAVPSSLGSLPPQQQALSTRPQLVSFSVSLDVNVLQDRINHLEAALKLAQKENQFLKEEKEAATQRHLDELRKREERHQLEIQKLKGKISQLKRELQGQTDRVSALEEDVKTLKEQARRSTDAAKRARYRLLVGTLAFTYVESAIVDTINQQKKMKQEMKWTPAELDGDEEG